jgi:hypothetical protein
LALAERFIPFRTKPLCKISGFFNTPITKGVFYLSYPDYNIQKHSNQVSFSVKKDSKKNRAVPIREELVAVTGDFKLAVVLGQLMYDCNLHPEIAVYIDEERDNRSRSKRSAAHGWIYMPAAELCDKTLMGVAPKTMRLWLHQLAEKGFIEIRKNQMDAYDQTHEYRINLVAIESAIRLAGFDLVSPLDELNEQTTPYVPSKKQNVRSIIKDLKPLDTKKNDKHNAHARDFDPDQETRTKYRKDMRSGAFKYWTDAEIAVMNDFADRETLSVCERLFQRGNALSSGESWLIHHVVSGDLPMSCAQSLIRLLHIQEVAGSAISKALELFAKLPAEICRNIIHPIRYLAEMVREQDSARLLNAM